MQHEIQINKPDIKVAMHTAPCRKAARKSKAWKKDNNHESTDISQNKHLKSSPLNSHTHKELTGP